MTERISVLLLRRRGRWHSRGPVQSCGSVHIFGRHCPVVRRLVASHIGIQERRNRLSGFKSLLARRDSPPEVGRAWTLIVLSPLRFVGGREDSQEQQDHQRSGPGQYQERFTFVFAEFAPAASWPLDLAGPFEGLVEHRAPARLAAVLGARFRLGILLRGVWCFTFHAEGAYAIFLIFHLCPPEMY